MAADLEKLSRMFRTAGHPDIAQGVKAWALVAASRGLGEFLGNGETSQTALDRAVQEYKSQPLTPESVNKFWQTLWKVEGSEIGRVFDVPSCDRTAEELTELKEEKRAVLLIPDEFYTRAGLVLLGRMFPNMRSRFVQGGTTITNENNRGGCIDVEMDLKSPNGNTTQKNLEELAFSKGRNGQRLATYMVASQFSKLLTGHYFDEGDTWSRVPGSRDGDGVVSAHFSPGGDLHVSSNLFPQGRYPGLGGRFEGVKKA